MTMLLWTGAAGAWLFPVVFLLDGSARPGYRQIRHPVSALALGPRGWLQTANFIVCGLAITAAAAPLGHATDSPLLAIVTGVFGLALVASGVFPMDPMRGYPPGTPDGTPEELSSRHHLHDWAGMAVFTALPAAAFIAAFVLEDPLWRWYSGLTATAFTAGFLAFGHAWETDAAYSGLIQRVTIICGWIWLGSLFLQATS